MASGGAVFANELAMPSNPGGSPPGNNGTVKVNDVEFDNGSSNANDPHVGCSFAIDFYNFDKGSIHATVNFALQAPTNQDQTMSSTGNTSPTFNGTGPTGGFQHTENYTLAFTGAPQPNQGYHVKITVQAPFGNGSESKSKVFWVGPCESTKVTPTAPTSTEASCQHPNITITPPRITGVVWSPTGSTVLKPGESITYTASAAQGYELSENAQTSWDFTNDFDTSNCEHHTTAVTPLAPSKTTPNCNVQTMTVTPRQQTGVVWTPSTSTTLQLGQSITYTASAAEGYHIAAGTQTSWTFTNDFDASHCENCGCEHKVTPGTVQFHDVCALENDYYKIPSTPHVKYFVNGSETAAGKYMVGMTGQVDVTAEADQGWTLSGGHEWSHDFTNVPCETKVTPPAPTFNDECGTENDTFTIPSKQGVEYRVNGEVMTAGEYSGEGTVTVRAFALSGFHLKGMTKWSHTFTDENCGGGHGGGPVTPGAVSFSDITCTTNGTFTIPSTEGVVYKDANGNVLTAGTHQVTSGMTVDVKAFPVNGSIELTGTMEWMHVFTVPTNCGGQGGGTVTPPSGGQGGGFVLGSSTEAPQVGGRGAAPELVNTGTDTLLTTALSLLMLSGSFAIYGRRTKFAHK
jgi:hypothetical protein